MSFPENKSGASCLRRVVSVGKKQTKTHGLPKSYLTEAASQFVLVVVVVHFSDEMTAIEIFGVFAKQTKGSSASQVSKGSKLWSSHLPICHVGKATSVARKINWSRQPLEYTTLATGRSMCFMRDFGDSVWSQGCPRLPHEISPTKNQGAHTAVVSEMPGFPAT